MIDKKQASEQSSTANLGLWIYLMTDLMLFAALFAAFMVLRRNVANGPAASEVFDMPYVLAETVVLLLSSLMIGVAWLSAKYGKRKAVIAYMSAGLVLGAVFLSMEMYEFSIMVADGHSWTESAFLSSYFTLVGTHGLHIAVGLLWGTVLLVRMIRGPWNSHVMRKLGLFVIFWHFLELVWIFIFSIVYMIGGNL